ncbi:4-carboxymuconolactone decarboxylase [Vulcanimicrobium alpinum]|uniref:4-carboxymuconolactone decarboxylase n=1 Tax=Vulcanimicrobium alpinum TaxID=3016050 RepID=A0AAN1XWK3_UNVUL|nr:4-carboxymuconolactone decarboxylase [Vulcanimicrobium alpinum]BDE06310.1 4-carboxymuconolactone decarboxylase [Vulcanimicrobium alpinum]
MSDKQYETGMSVRRAVLGEEHVDRAAASTTEFTRDFQRYITENVWGELWTRPGLDRHARSMLTIAITAALGRWEELELHVRATRNTGVTRDEVKEILLHVAAYAGVPAANTAYAHAAAVYARLDDETNG